MLLNATLDFIREKRVQSVETRAKAGKIFVQASPLYVLWLVASHLAVLRSSQFVVSNVLTYLMYTVLHAD